MSRGMNERTFCSLERAVGPGGGCGVHDVVKPEASKRKEATINGDISQ